MCEQPGPRARRSPRLCSDSKVPGAQVRTNPLSPWSSCCPRLGCMQTQNLGGREALVTGNLGCWRGQATAAQWCWHQTSGGTEWLQEQTVPWKSQPHLPPRPVWGLGRF